jgi:raffinose/stachyose/melibiose transport system substrate-binding protein
MYAWCNIFQFGGKCIMKKVFLSLLAVLLTVGMVSAGGRRQGSAGGQKKQLAILQHIGEEPSLRWLEFVIKTFQERNPDVNVELQNMSFDSYVTTLQTKIASNDAPDIFPTEGEQMQSFYTSGYLLDMTGQSFVQNFNPDDLALVTINGEFIAVPSGFGSMCVVYNKELFTSAGINKVPETLTEFYDA